MVIVANTQTTMDIHQDATDHRGIYQLVSKVQSVLNSFHSNVRNEHYFISHAPDSLQVVIVM